ncbi:thiamine phosphate synthase [Duganella callida]|uniref:Thiamine-phosphate synthase n=1 Tax=Duganella callida TaxID=2561932 RepID=A0A4Y9SNL0_9BURK|nr:thiamine phosphate synthase [Duganella callida]TFW26549.1 thiamine phosphate synthase [Duganella callida]
MHGLYLVTPDWNATDRLLAVTGQALRAGPIALLQYRHKEATPALRREQASALLALCRRYHVPFIVNDFADLCAEIDADGVHLGGADAQVAEVRARLGRDKIIGASCYGELPRALDAQQAGASYVAFGGFYPSKVKKYAVTTPVEILDQARAAIRVPTVVIGGMTPHNAAPLVARGAHMVAAISSVYQAESVAAAVRDFLSLYTK